MNFLEKLEDINANIRDWEDTSDIFDSIGFPVLNLEFAINEEKGVIICLDLHSLKRHKVKCAQGDKFDLETGVKLVMFEIMTGHNYDWVSRSILKFAEITETNDPTLTFMKKTVDEHFNIDVDLIKTQLDKVIANQDGYKTVKLVTM